MVGLLLSHPHCCEAVVCGGVGLQIGAATSGLHQVLCLYRIPLHLAEAPVQRMRNETISDTGSAGPYVYCLVPSVSPHSNANMTRHVRLHYTYNLPGVSSNTGPNKRALHNSNTMNMRTNGMVVSFHAHRDAISTRSTHVFVQCPAAFSQGVIKLKARHSSVASMHIPLVEPLFQLL